MNERPIIEFLSPDALPAPFAAYSHGALVRSGADILFSSGQLGVKADGTIPPSVEGQTAVIFANLNALLIDRGMGLADIVRLNAYVTGREYMAGYMRVRDEQFTGTPPASTLLIVSGFTKPDFVVEIEVVAARLSH